MKKGISLIVLVITIIVMIIIAAAIILSLNSSNVTNKANWAQISADRANLQSEFATILADVVAKQKVGAGQDYIGVTVTDLEDDEDGLYTDWKAKVEATNTRFDVLEEDETNPAGIKVVMYLTATEAEAFGLIDSADSVTTGTTVPGYDWVKIGTVSTGSDVLTSFN